MAKPVLLRWIARVILVLWALFWLYFNIGSGIAERSEYGAQSMFGHFGAAAITLLLVLIAWFFEGAGGILLILVALTVSYFLVMHFSRWAGFTVPTLALPALVAGVLLVLNQWAVRKPRS
jgi:hypothetical protein